MAKAVPLRPVAVVRPQTDPLLAALIAKLPATGAGWPLEQRTAWLQMMWMSFDVVYGPAGGEGAIDLPAFLRPRAPGADETAKQDAAPTAPPPKPSPQFYIDLAGNVLGASGEPVLPGDVDDLIVDKRGEQGNLGSIVWADGSVGLPKGLQLDITTSGF